LLKEFIKEQAKESLFTKVGSRSPRPVPKLRVPKVPPRIVVKESVYRLARQGDARSRFLFAHELGHLVLHPQSTHFRAPNGPKLNKLIKKIEAQASKFALFFLIPDSVARQFSSAESLSLHCQVRREVAELRMEYLTPNNKEERANVERRIEELFTRTVRDVKGRKASVGG
jgi:Zn-dependent peptidase ImmA (M78 family)